MQIIQQMIVKAMIVNAKYEFSAISMVALEWESKPDINA